MVLLWPDTNEDMKILFWLSEAVWVLEIGRKLTLNADEHEDEYVVAINYIKSSFALDILATVP